MQPQLHRWPTECVLDFSNYIHLEFSIPNLLISKQISYGHYATEILYRQDIQTDIEGCWKMGYYKRIRELREDHDLTQRQLAAMLRITQTQYFRYEQGYRDIPTDLLIVLAKHYKTSTDYILGLSDNPNPLD